MGIVAQQDWSRARLPHVWAEHTENFQQLALLGPQTGTVHTDLGLCQLGPGGRVAAHLHSYEEAVYVLEGEPSVQIADAAYQLGPGDFAFFPVGTVHAFANFGNSQARWMYVNSPVALRWDSGRRDTSFPRHAAVDLTAVPPPDLANPALRLIGHYDGIAAGAAGATTVAPAGGSGSAGLGTGLIADRGVTVTMLVDRSLGAHLLTLFVVDYAVEGPAQVHDHPFEESYFFLDGETTFELAGKQRKFAPGYAAWAGVGETHACLNPDGGPVRWLETQAPAAPTQHSFRWPAQWDQYQKSYC